MTRIPTTIAVAAAAVLLAGPAWALDIRNGDSRDYEVTIVTGDEENAYTFTLPAGSEESAVCKGCRIWVEGVGVLDGVDVEKVEIVGGKFRM